MSKSKLILGTSMFVSLIMLTACGGGGGGGSSSGFEAPAISHTPIDIDESNEAAVTQAGLDATTGSADLGSQVPFSPFSLDGDDSKTVSPNVYQLIRRVVTNNIRSDIGTSRSVVGVEISGSDPCFVSGREIYNGDVADISGNSISSGDTVTIVYEGCDDGYGEVLNGSMTITFNSDIPDINTFDYFNFNLTVRFSNFQSTQMGYGTVTLDGEIDVAMAVSGNMFTFRMSGVSLYVVDPNSSTHLTNFDISFSINESTLETVIDSNFTIANTLLDGQITVDVYFVIPWGNQYPSSGSLTITGNNSQLAVDVVGDGTVNVTLTANGVVQAGYPKNVTWAELGVEINSVIF